MLKRCFFDTLMNFCFPVKKHMSNTCKNLSDYKQFPQIWYSLLRPNGKAGNFICTPYTQQKAYTSEFSRIPVYHKYSQYFQCKIVMHRFRSITDNWMSGKLEVRNRWKQEVRYDVRKKFSPIQLLICQRGSYHSTLRQCYSSLGLTTFLE